MDVEEHVMKVAASSVKRRGYALASVVALIFLMTILLGVAVSWLEYSSRVMEAHFSRFLARNALESMTNLSLRWLSARVREGARPRAAVSAEFLTNSELLIIFASNDLNGCDVKIYDLDYDAGEISDTSRIFPPSCPGGYMIRASAVRNNLAPLTQESVYMVTTNALPGGITAEILDEKPVYSRELFRD